MSNVVKGSVSGSVSSLVLAMLALAGAGHAADKYQIVNEGGIGKDWALADGVKLAVPGYPAAFVERGDSVCVALGYAIKPDGTTSDFTALKSWSSGTGADGKEPASGYWDAFVQTGANSVAQWKFKPKEAGATQRATYTVATIFFNGKPAMDVTALRGKCAIPDLAAFVQEQKSSAFMASRDKHEMENAQARAARTQAEQNAAKARSLLGRPSN